MAYQDPLYGKYITHKGNAKQRGIAFNLTFEEWLSIWKASGRINKMGNRRGQYCMARHGDIGGYAIGNVEIVASGVNHRTRHEIKAAIVGAQVKITLPVFRAACEALWGEQYRAPAARVLGMHLRTLMRYDAGERTVPPAVFAKLAKLLMQHRVQVETLVPKVQAAAGNIASPVSRS